MATEQHPIGSIVSDDDGNQYVMEQGGLRMLEPYEYVGEGGKIEIDQDYQDYMGWEKSNGGDNYDAGEVDESKLNELIQGDARLTPLAGTPHPTEPYTYADGQGGYWSDSPLVNEVMPGETGIGDAIKWLAEKTGLPPEAAMAMAAIVSRNPKQVKESVTGLFTPRKTKKNLTDKRGTKSGEVVKGGKKGDTINAKGDFGKRKDQAKSQQHMQRNYGNADKNTKQITKVDGKGGPLVKTNNGVTRKLGLTDRNKELATAGALTGGVIANRLLRGNRNEQGDFVVADPVISKDDGSPEGNELFYDGPSEPQGNQFGYHKRPGQNFWTINDSDPYWNTHEMGTGSAWSDAELKKAPAKELDWSSLFD